MCEAAVMPLIGLVEGQVEGVAGRGRDHRIGGPVEGFQHHARDKLHALPVCSHGVAGSCAT